MKPGQHCWDEGVIPRRNILLSTLPKRLRKPQGAGERNLSLATAPDPYFILPCPAPATLLYPLHPSETCRSSLQPVSELSLLGLCTLPSWHVFPFLLLLAEGMRCWRGVDLTLLSGIFGCLFAGSLGYREAT